MEELVKRNLEFVRLNWECTFYLLVYWFSQSLFSFLDFDFRLGKKEEQLTN